LFVIYFIIKPEKIINAYDTNITQAKAVTHIYRRDITPHFSN